MTNLIDTSARDTCPLCGGKQKVLTLPNCLEWDEKQEAWVPLTVSICDKCGHTTIHPFHPEIFHAVHRVTIDAKTHISDGCVRLMVYIPPWYSTSGWSECYTTLYEGSQYRNLNSVRSATRQSMLIMESSFSVKLNRRFQVLRAF